VGEGLCAAGSSPAAGSTRSTSPMRHASAAGTRVPVRIISSARNGGRLRLIATLEDPTVVVKILAHRGLLHPGDFPGPAPPSADLPVEESVMSRATRPLVAYVQ